MQPEPAAPAGAAPDAAEQAPPLTVPSDATDSATVAADTAPARGRRARGVRGGTRVVRDITNGYLGPSKRLIPVVVLSSVVVALAQAATLVVLSASGVALAAGKKHVSLSVGPLHLGMPVAVAMITATAISVVMVVVQVSSGGIAARLAEIAEAESRRRLVSAYVDATWELIARRERGEFQQLLTANVLRVSRALVNRTVFIFGITNLIILLAAGLVVAPLVALLMVAAGALLAIPLRPVKKRTQQAAEQHGVAERNFATFIAGLVEQARETRVFNVGVPLVERSNVFSDAAAGKQRRMQFLLWTTPAIYLGGALLALTLGVTLIAVTGTSQLSSVGTMVVLFLRSLVYGQGALVAMQYIIEAQPYLVEMEADLASYNASRRPDGGVDPGPLQLLELRGVSYRYPGSERAALRDVDLTVHRGDAIGVVGATGSGKSTLAEIVLRLRDPGTGSYLVNGTPSAEIAAGAWSRIIAYVPQHAVIIDGTIRDNIRYFRPWIDDAAVEQAARDAHLDEEIRRMPQGYDTVVVGLSVGLSGGQRQRLCIARALAGRPQFLVMDEPTSGLDGRSERLFIETISELRSSLTLLIIAHRLGTIEMCNRIITVADGVIQRQDAGAGNAPAVANGHARRPSPRGRHALPEADDALPEAHDALPKAHDALPGTGAQAVPALSGGTGRRNGGRPAPGAAQRVSSG